MGKLRISFHTDAFRLVLRRFIPSLPSLYHCLTYRRAAYMPSVQRSGTEIQNTAMSGNPPFLGCWSRILPNIRNAYRWGRLQLSDMGRNALHTYRSWRVISCNLLIVKRCCMSFLNFYARQHICYSASMLWQFRLSVHLSVRLSVRLSHGWISQKRLKLGSRNFPHTVAPSL